MLGRVYRFGALAAPVLGMTGLLLAGCSAPSQPGFATPAPTPPPRSGSIEGVVSTPDPVWAPVEDAHVYEYALPDFGVRTDADGWFELPLLEPEAPVIVAVAPGFVTTVFATAPDWGQNDLLIDLFDEEREVAKTPLDFGEPWDPARGSVIVLLISDGDTAPTDATVGAGIALDLPYRSAWVLNPLDLHYEDTIIPPGAPTAEVWFLAVDPGLGNVDVRPPTGVTCSGPPEAVPVIAGAYTLVWVFCERDAG